MSTKLIASLVRQHLEDTVEYLHPYLSFANTALINYIVDDLWLEQVPKSIQNEIKCEDDVQKAVDLFWSLMDKSTVSIDCTCFPNFCKYVNDSNRRCLDELPDLWITPGTLKKSICTCSAINERGFNLNGFMSTKKTHEVEVTSEIIANMCSSYSARGREPIVVDAGDGKGYLSSRLALQYKFKVLGIDANSINTNGAMARLEKLEKQWDSLERQYKNEQAGIIVEKTGRRKRRQITRNASAVNDDGVEQNTENYKAITHYITETTDFLQLLKENFDTINLTHPAICLSGLHTCGNLASSCLRTFRDSNQIAAVCNIGCCYNNLDEQFKHSSDDSLPEIRFRVYEGKIIPIESIETTKDTYGFPMSQFLIEKKYALGRNARMLSVQPIDRVVDFRENLHDNIFYRALFEVLIVDHYPQYKNAIHVGRIKKCDTFVDYVRKCSKRMTILNFDHLTDAELDDVFHKHLHHKNFLIIFFLMRLCLAPIIETVILLDRLLYLLEANHDEQSSIYLVKFFDSVVSPRCYGIVALK